MTARGTASFVLAASMSTSVLICSSGVSVPAHCAVGPRAAATARFPQADATWRTRLPNRRFGKSSPSIVYTVPPRSS